MTATRPHAENAGRAAGRLRPPPPARHRRHRPGQQAQGTEIKFAGIARAAAVDRTFLYRHRDLLEQIHALEAAPPSPGDGCRAPRSPARPSRRTCSPPTNAPSGSAPASGNSKNGCPRHSASRHGANPDSARHPDIDALTARIAQAEQQAADLRIQLADRDDELAAARAANRELMTRINHEHKNQ